MTADLTEAISGLDLINLHWDDRGAELSVSFEGPLKRPFSPDEPDHDHVRLRLSFTGVSEFRVRGWSHIPIDSATVTQTADGVEATFTGPATSAEVTARSVELLAVSTFRLAAP
ncbi:Imm50 family immunity protein [Actinokineospora sp. NBRC 105648]|uniref:Imm50 family immunity protein n=1 Tax=Actinokineospora sp. NBRC 105648 TaxID=3032206 RepID=UPI0024A1BED9|nr:Imm50 family immunity protein [Actinokineospora sp. NBRC 105648]GLZ37631.1 hypothetical protein Acsp05_12560 [Actinokineospora sp. NBRC 105648]